MILECMRTGCRMEAVLRYDPETLMPLLIVGGTLLLRADNPLLPRFRLAQTTPHERSELLKSGFAMPGCPTTVEDDRPFT